MKTYLDDADLTLYNGDALEVLRSLPDESVHMCVTSPPFYGLRDYGTGRWEGGNPDCDHQRPPRADAVAPHSGKSGNQTGSPPQIKDLTFYGVTCGKCGASRVDQQIGLEETPEQWVEKLVGVFREVRRVLRGDGTLWLEIGDSYAGSPGGSGGWDGNNKTPDGQPRTSRHASERWKNGVPNLKAKDLIGAPWLLAFALRADGWYLRSDVVWSRPNPMPESVTDRPTKSHSYVFLLSKSARYFFDQEAVREPLLPQSLERGYTASKFGNGLGKKAEANPDRNNAGEPWTIPTGRNVRSVWSIPTQAYSEAHFATFPEELVRRCILAGSSERGCCPECGAPWERETERESFQSTTRTNPSPEHLRGGHASRGPSDEVPRPINDVKVTTKGWRPSCGCVWNSRGQAVYAPPPPIPCTVLDPFAGSGTTGLVARKHGRRSVLIELSAEYCGLVARRTQQLSLEAEPA